MWRHTRRTGGTTAQGWSSSSSSATTQVMHGGPSHTMHTAAGRLAQRRKVRVGLLPGARVGALPPQRCLPCLWPLAMEPCGARDYLVCFPVLGSKLIGMTAGNAGV